MEKADDDRRDVAKVLAGDVGAFANIVRRWQGPLVNLACRFCRDRGRAEEMAQEAFLRAWRALPTWRGDSAFSTWLFALATNLYRTEIRRVPPRAVPITEASALHDSGRTDAEIEEIERDLAIRRAVYALPAKYRDAMVLFYFHEKNIQDAALSLGLPEGTVKARLSRGRDILRQKFKGTP
jgi:RNA polymerase sigma-70 factor (ECF subfamily)